MGSRTVSTISTVITANNTKFKKGISGAQKSLGGFQKSLGSLKGMIVGAFAVGAIASFAKEASRAAAEAEGIERAFRAINKPGLLEELRTAVKGTVSDVRLMQSAVKANNFKIPLEQLGTFFQFAQQRAVETGESVDYLVESITNGIARKSLPILDNLGLSATEVRDEFNKTGDMASAVANIISRDMGKTADATLTTAELYDQAAANAANLKVQMGEIVNLGVNKMLPFLQKRVDFLRQAFMTEKMIKRQVMDANTLYQIEQDAAEVQLLANKYKERGLDLLEGQTFEQRAALSMIEQYKTLLVNTNEGETAKIELYTSQIQALEDIAGIKPRRDSIVDPESWEKTEKAIKGAKDELEAYIATLRMTTHDALGKDGGGQPWDEEGIFDLPEEIISEPELDTLLERFEKMKLATEELNRAVSGSVMDIADSFARGLGEAAAGVREFGSVLDDLGAMIFQALGDIMIMAGMEAGVVTPEGAALILGGLAFKGVGAFMGASGKSDQSWQGYNFSGSSSVGTSTIYGNDIRTANNHSTNLYGKIG